MVNYANATATRLAAWPSRDQALRWLTNQGNHLTHTLLTALSQEPVGLQAAVSPCQSTVCVLGRAELTVMAI